MNLKHVNAPPPSTQGFKQVTMTEVGIEATITSTGGIRVDTQIATTTITRITTITVRTIRAGMIGRTGMIIGTGIGTEIETEIGDSGTRMITRDLASSGWSGGSAETGTGVCIPIPVGRGLHDHGVNIDSEYVTSFANISAIIVLLISC